MPFISKAKTGTGRTIQVLGYLIWGLCGLATLIWELYILYSIFGIWTIFVGLIFAPITYIASVLIVWFSTGIFPWFLFVIFLVSLGGLGIAALGGTIAGDN